jgi:single-strand DNA-binding protein
MNNISLIGNLTRDLELRSAKGGAVCQLRIAVDKPGRNGAKGEPTYVDVATFGKHAESCAAHLAKGRQVAVSGRLVFREWEAKDGSKRSAHEVRGSVQFLGSKGDGLVVPGRRGAEEVPIPF